MAHSEKEQPKQPERKRRPKRRNQSYQKWGVCDVCEQNLPIVPETGMCGPCTFGEADTLLGDW